MSEQSKICYVTPLVIVAFIAIVEKTAQFSCKTKDQVCI